MSGITKLGIGSIATRPLNPFWRITSNTIAMINKNSNATLCKLDFTSNSLLLLAERHAIAERSIAFPARSAPLNVWKPTTILKVAKTIAIDVQICCFMILSVLLMPY